MVSVILQTSMRKEKTLSWTLKQLRRLGQTSVLMSHLAWGVV